MFVRVLVIRAVLTPRFEALNTPSPSNLMENELAHLVLAAPICVDFSIRRLAGPRRDQRVLLRMQAAGKAAAGALFIPSADFSLRSRYLDGTWAGFNRDHGGCEYARLKGATYRLRRCDDACCPGWRVALGWIKRRRR
jgi:hypothetical protein